MADVRQARVVQPHISLLAVNGTPHSYRVDLGRQGRRHHWHFRFAAHGGQRKALQAAQGVLARALASLGPAVHGSRTGVQSGPVRAASGVRGVNVIAGIAYAVWYEPRRTKHRVNCGSGLAGFQKACAVRRAAERRLQRRAKARP